MDREAIVDHHEIGIDEVEDAEVMLEDFLEKELGFTHQQHLQVV